MRCTTERMRSLRSCGQSREMYIYHFDSIFCEGEVKADVILLAVKQKTKLFTFRGINLMIVMKSKKRNLGGFVHQGFFRQTFWCFSFSFYMFDLFHSISTVLKQSVAFEVILYEYCLLQMCLFGCNK